MFPKTAYYFPKTKTPPKNIFAVIGAISEKL